MLQVEGTAAGPERWETLVHMELLCEAGSCSPSSGRTLGGRSRSREAMKDPSGPGRWVHMYLEVELTGHGCEGRDQGWLLAFERPEHLGRWWMAVTKTEGRMLVEAR